MKIFEYKNGVARYYIILIVCDYILYYIILYYIEMVTFHRRDPVRVAGLYYVEIMAI